MKFKYSIFISALVLYMGNAVSMERKPEKNSEKKLTLAKRASSLFSKKVVNNTSDNLRRLSIIPQDFMEKNDNPKLQRRSSNVLLLEKRVDSLLKGKKPILPKASKNDPNNIKRFSEIPEKEKYSVIQKKSENEILKNNNNNNSLKKPESKIEVWELDNDTDLENLNNALMVYSAKKSLTTTKTIALEYDMASINTEESLQYLFKNILNVMPFAKLDDGQVKVGLLMLYLDNPEELSQVIHRFSDIPGITGVKDSAEYTKRHGLISLVNRNLNYIDKEALITFWLEEGNLSFEDILAKLDQDKETIQEIYYKVLKKLESQKNTPRTTENTPRTDQSSSKEETPRIEESNPNRDMHDLFGSNSSEENWDEI